MNDQRVGPHLAADTPGQHQQGRLCEACSRHPGEQHPENEKCRP